MSKSDKHAEGTAKKFGGKSSDYLEIHEMMDSSKSAFGDNRHRAIFHTTLGCYYIQKMFGIDFEEVDKLRKKYNLPDQFIEDVVQLIKHNRSHGVHIKNSDGKKIHVRDVAESHILDDFRQKFIPTLSDYLENMKLTSWMNNAMADLPSKERKSTIKQVNFRIKEVKE
tara:strand:+ start:478 stop:981 length:504 start_codon:yes stop_codon:yes gene_type:complete